MNRRNLNKAERIVTLYMLDGEGLLDGLSQQDLARIFRVAHRSTMLRTLESLKRVRVGYPHIRAEWLRPALADASRALRFFFSNCSLSHLDSSVHILPPSQKCNLKKSLSLYHQILTIRLYRDILCLTRGHFAYSGIQQEKGGEHEKKDRGDIHAD